ncbi:MAG: hypothetical protein DRH11_12190 [Deltaproteobacteria bacterium]|nr:MAG: hypothetical protein DRH11_12190 [Deltaproteobacteria bacterium]
MEKLPRVVNEKIAAKLLGLSVTTLRNWRCLRKGPPYLKFGAAVRYRLTDLKEFAMRHRVEPPFRGSHHLLRPKEKYRRVLNADSKGTDAGAQDGMETKTTARHVG